MAAAWVPLHAPWSQLARSRFKALQWSKLHLRTNTTISQTFDPSFLASGDHPSMIAMRNRPYPTEGWDISLFEEPEAVEEDMPDLTYEVRRPCFVLAQLVQDGKLSEAKHVRGELHNMGIRIHPDNVYERVAVEEALRPTDPKVRISTFMSWWSLVPQPAEEDPLWACKSLQSDILVGFGNSEARRIVTAVLHAAYRGHSSVATDLFLPYIIPSSSATFITAFLDDICAASPARFSSAATDGSDEQTRQSSLYDCAIKTLCFSRRPHDALTVFGRACTKGVKVNKYSFTTLTLALHRVQDAAAANKLATVWKLSTGLRDIPFIPDKSIDAGVPLHKTFSRLRALLHANRLPVATRLRRYIQACLAAENYEALLALRGEYLKFHRPEAAMRIWAREEMHCFTKRDQKEAVLASFVRYFEMVGIPSTAMIDRIMSRKREESTRHHSHKGPSPGDATFSPRRPRESALALDFIPPYLRGSDTQLPHKLIPTRHHTIYIWQALIRMAKGDTLLALYQHFLDCVKQDILRCQAQSAPARRDDAPHSVANQSGFIVTEEEVEPLLDVSHFNFFLLRFTLRGEHKETLRVIEDMRCLGIKAEVETFTQIIAKTKAADSQYVLTFLDQAEGFELEYTAGRRGIARTDDAVNKDPQFPLLLLATSAISTYLENGQLGYARAVQKRIEDRLKYIPGTNRITDAALKEFRRDWAEYLKLEKARRLQSLEQMNGSHEKCNNSPLIRSASET